MVTEIVEYFLDKLPEMDPALLTHLMKSLIYGIKHSIFPISSCAFDAIVSIGFFAWFEATKFGSEKIQFMANHLDFLLQQTFQYIIFEDFDSDLVSHAGDGLFGLAMARQDTFRMAVEQLLSQQRNVNVQQKLSIEFHALTKIMMQVAEMQHEDIKNGTLSVGFGDFYGTNKTLKFFKVNCSIYTKEYQKQFFIFVMHVRGIIRVK